MFFFWCIGSGILLFTFGFITSVEFILCFFFICCLFCCLFMSIKFYTLFLSLLLNIFYYYYYGVFCFVLSIKNNKLVLIALVMKINLYRRQNTVCKMHYGSYKDIESWENIKQTHIPYLSFCQGPSFWFFFSFQNTLERIKIS